MDIETSPPVRNAAKVESARYALIRRLGFVFRHHLVVNLQPLSMVYQVMRHRLSADPIDVPALLDSVDQVERLVRASIRASSDVVSWLTPGAQTRVGLAEVVAECLSNVRSSFSFRGFVIRFEDAAVECSVDQMAVREVLTAALIAATDQAKGRGELVVGAVAGDDAAVVTIETRPSAEPSQAEQGAYRLLDWDDVNSLAEAHGLQFLQIASDQVQIVIPYMD